MLSNFATRAHLENSRDLIDEHLLDQRLRPAQAGAPADLIADLPPPHTPGSPPI